MIFILYAQLDLQVIVHHNNLVPRIDDAIQYHAANRNDYGVGAFHVWCILLHSAEELAAFCVKHEAKVIEVNKNIELLDTKYEAKYGLVLS